MSDVVHGLYITVLGMGLVFLTLGAIYLLMTLLVKFLPPKTAPAATQPPAVPLPTEDLEGEKVAAISVALARALAEDVVALTPAGVESFSQASGWTAAGRNRQLSHPQSREKKL